MPKEVSAINNTVYPPYDDPSWSNRFWDELSDSEKQWLIDEHARLELQDWEEAQKNGRTWVQVRGFPICARAIV